MPKRPSPRTFKTRLHQFYAGTLKAGGPIPKNRPGETNRQLAERLRSAQAPKRHTKKGTRHVQDQ